jgi:hypothetical protein
MAKKVVQTEQVQEEQVNPETATVFTVVSKDGKYIVYKGELNLDNSSVLRECSTRDEANETFKIEVAKAGILG